MSTASGSSPHAAQSGAPRIPDYELVRLVGRGSYGDVWLARGLTGIWRAIKIVWRERFKDALPFEREFKGLKEFAQISLGESIQLALLHVGRNDTEGFFYYVMELADDVDRGRLIEPANYVPLTLAELRRRRERLAPQECVRIGMELARVLAGLHRRGLVHRDIKPSNVILVDGVPKLADIGLVAPVTSARTFVGTEGYVPPEGPGSPAADVFALGKVLYELATGLDRQEFPQLPANLNRLPDHRALLRLNAIVLRACDPLPDRRYSDAAAMFADLSALHAGRSVPGRWTRAWTTRVAAAVLVLLVVTGASWWWRTKAAANVAAPAAAARADAAKSIAVLPFANLSDEKDANAFFADGIHEDILTNLALIAELRVVSRTTVLGYRATTKPTGQIGNELGVAYLLEGSVRRSGNKVRVTGQLIDARTDRHIWAKNYDRDLTDVFAIQAALAEEIATALATAISPETRKQITRRPTENSAAYDLYLKGRDVRNRGRTGSWPALTQAERHFAEAVELDPNFAAAWGELAVVHALQIFWYYDASAERKAKGIAAIDRALRLAPDATDVMRLAANHAYYAHRDYSGATAVYEKIIRQQPNDPTSYASLGMIQSRQGRWAEAMATLRRAVELEPANLGHVRNLGAMVFMLRRWDESRELQRRITALLGNPLSEQLQTAHSEYLRTGSFEAPEAILDRLSATERETPEALYFRKEWAIRRGDYAEFKRLDERQPSYAEGVTPTFSAILAATVHLIHGDADAARARVAATYDETKALLQRQPGNQRTRFHLAAIEGVLGRPDEARRLIRETAAAMPDSLDALEGNNTRYWLAGVSALIGDNDVAIDALLEYTRKPGGFTIFAIRDEPVFKPLHGDPRFRALLNDPKNRAPLF